MRSDFPLPSLKSLGLLEYRPTDTRQRNVMNVPPPLRVPSRPTHGLGAPCNQGGTTETTDMPWWSQPSQNTTTNDNHSQNVIAQTGDPSIVTDEPLVSAGDIHPKVAGEGGGQGKCVIITLEEFDQESGRLKKA